MGKTDLISRAAAIEEIARRDTTDGTVKVYSGREINAILSDLPAVDAVPVVHGRWVYEHDDPVLLPCSVCGYQVYRYNNTHYCPNCGAKMDKEG